MSSKDRYGKFKKKDYVRILNGVRYYLCRKFVYKIKPYIFETQLKENALMLFTHTAGRYAIFYDYKQFKEMFGHRDFETQEAYAAAIMAHEMRHYYQHRQMIAKKPKEKIETVALWRENEWNPKYLEDGYLLRCHVTRIREPLQAVSSEPGDNSMQLSAKTGPQA